MEARKKGTVQIQSKSEMERSIAQVEKDKSVKKSLGKIKNKLLVMSGKGGVGKTSVSVNLSIALANMGYQVGLMDVDIHGPDVPRMLGLNGMLDFGENNKLSPMRYSENLRAVSIESLIVNKDDAIIWRGPMKNSIIKQFLGEVGWGDLDYLVIDSPPGTGDEPLTIAQTISDVKAVIVTTPQEVSLADVRKSISFCRTVKMEILGLIENMSGFNCPHCGKGVDLFGSGGGERTAKAAGIHFIGKIPFDPKVVSCGDAGESLQEKYKGSPTSAAFEEIARKIADKG
ncbi:MAG: Mrp/NBP35 family ATP-binding protein [Desulfobacterales bacterium]|nr:Mrp/NBP35 family ATP-binding protein [Desulfobacterales bacterium]